MPYYRDHGQEQSVEIEPTHLGIDPSVRAAPLPDELRKTGGADEDTTAAHAGMAALAGQSGPTREGLVFAAALCLWHAGRYESVPAAARAVREVLDSGKVLARIQSAG